MLHFLSNMTRIEAENVIRRMTPKFRDKSVIGDPKPTEKWSSGELDAMGLIGLYEIEEGNSIKLDL